MPTNEAQFGEVWTTTDVASGRTMLGVVADVTPTRITFVSLTGHRSAVPQSRLLTTWRYVQPAPRRTLPLCSRWGCSEAGMVQFNRGGATEYICPRHVPFGIQCQITTNYSQPPEGQPNLSTEPLACPCLACGSPEPVEDVRFMASPARLWLCAPPGCSARWVTVPRTLAESNVEAFAEAVRVQLARWHFEPDALVVLHHDLWSTFRRSPNVDVREPQVSTQLSLRNGMAAMLDPMTERMREHFWAVIRVRGSIPRERPAAPIQRLGGAPSRAGVVGSASNPTSPIQHMSDRNTTTYRPTQQARDQASAAAALGRLAQRERELFEAPAATAETPPEPEVPDVKIEGESLWVQRASGGIMIVRDTGRSTNGTEVVTFRKSISEDGDGDAYVTMTRRDFLIQHRQYGQEKDNSSSTTIPMVALAPDEEWECQDGSGSSMIITQVDYRRETVHGRDMKSQKARQIPFVQFTTGRWRKIVRKSAYARLRNPEIGED